MIDDALQHHWGFYRVREVPGRDDCVIQGFYFTCGLLVGVKLDQVCIDYAARYCYESVREAAIALETWDGIGDPPGDWLKEKVSERLGPGCKCREHGTQFTAHIQYKHGTAECETERVYVCPDCAKARQESVPI